MNNYEANETVEAANALNCTLTNSMKYLDDRDVRPLFLSHNTLKSHFASFRGGNTLTGSQIPKMLKADYTEDEGYVSEDMADSFDFDQDRYISKAISQSTQIIHQTAAYAPDFVFNTVTIVCYMVNKRTNRKRKVRCLIDDASDISLVLRSTADKLGLKGKKCSADFTGTGSFSQHFENEKQVEFTLEALDGSYETDVIQACTLPTVSSGYRPIGLDPKEYSHLRDCDNWTEQFPTPEKVAKTGVIDILLGTPHVHRIKAKLPSLGGPIEPIGIHTKLGSSISAPMWPEGGSIHNTTLGEPIFVVHHSTEGQSDQGIAYEELERLFTLDSLGIECPTQTPSKLTATEAEAIRMVNETTTYDPDEPGYTTGLPWRDGRRLTDTNERAAKRISERFRNQIQRDPELAQGWTNAYAEAEERGFCRPLTEEELKMESGIHYISTFCVKQPQKPLHPFRLVVAANQKMGPQDGRDSLNDRLHVGFNYLTDLPKLIIRARQALYILCADISRFFLRIKVKEDDAHFQRFYALKMGTDGKVKIVPSIFTSLSFGLNSSPFVSAHILREHARKYFTNDDPIIREAAKQICESSYCDDIIMTSDNEEELTALVGAMVMILGTAGLPVGKFTSNSAATLAAFPEQSLQSDRTKILGCVWKPKEDTLTFNMVKVPEPVSGCAGSGEIPPSASRATESPESDHKPETPTAGPYTKRQILSVAARIFDPIGICSAFSVIPKMLVQECWAREYSWDQPVEQDIAERFQKVIEELPNLEAVTVPRCYRPSAEYDISELVAYCDASELGFAANIYLLSVNKRTGERHAALAFAKAKVAPISKRPKKGAESLGGEGAESASVRKRRATWKTGDKVFTICRLELLSAATSVVAAHYVQSALGPIPGLKRRFFSDSMVTLHRISGDINKYYIWVHNRLKRILEYSEVDEWAWVRSEDNPSDLGSRGVLLGELNSSELWKRGPEYLTQQGYDFDSHTLSNITLSNELSRVDKQETRQTVSTFSQSCLHRDKMCTTDVIKYLSGREESEIRERLSHSTSGGDKTVSEKRLEGAVLVRVAAREFWLRKDPDDTRKCGLLYRYQHWDQLIRTVSRLLQMADWIHIKVEAKRAEKRLGLSESDVERTRESRRQLGFESQMAKFKPLSCAAYARGELFVFRLAQYIGFTKLVERMKGGEDIDFSHPLDRESIFWDPRDCIIRLKGRTPKSDVIPLPKHSRVADLYLRDLHLRYGHVSGDAFIALAQKRVYVLGGRYTYKKAYRCCSCRDSRKLTQVMSQLPVQRTEMTMRGFKYISCDYLHISCYDNLKSQTPRKRYVLVITCLTTRATHLELVKSMRTEDFIAALRSHIALNGMFSVCWSDNALYFKEASATLRGFLKGIDFKQVEEHLTTTSPGSHWRWFTPKHSAQAGCVERVVGLVKMALDKSLGQKHQRRHRKFTTDEMRILLYEVANMLNNRPLSAVFSQKGEISNVVNITPNLLIRGQSTYCLADNFRFQRHARPADKLNDINKVYRDRQHLLRLFWQQFSSSYVRMLKFTKRWHQSFTQDIPEGTFVLLREENLKKNETGRLVPALVTEVYRREDGLINQLKVRAEGYKDEILRHIRDFALMENDYLKITQPLHRCLIHDLSEAAKVDKLEAELPLDHNTRQLIEGSGLHEDAEDKGNAAETKAEETAPDSDHDNSSANNGIQTRARTRGLRKRSNKN